MKSNEIKDMYSMREIVERYGIKINRSGFCSCPFHQGDHTPSMKIYQKDYHCHSCGANGDVFTFVGQMDGLSFKDTFLSLGGTYEEYKQEQADRKKFSILRKQEQRKREKEKRKQLEMNLRKQRIRYQKELHMLLDIIQANQPYLDNNQEPVFPDVWVAAVNRFEYVLYILHHLQEELEGGLRSGVTR